MLPAKMSKKRIVRRYKERYRTEQAYEERKGELGRGPDQRSARRRPGRSKSVPAPASKIL
jgi:hypothetical protein